MTYVDKILQTDEVVLARTEIHWFIYLRSIITFLLAIALLAASTLASADIRLYVEVAAAAIAVIGLWFLFIAWIRRRSTELAVTNRRIIYKTGFFGRSTQEMNRQKVESVDVRQSLPGRRSRKSSKNFCAAPAALRGKPHERRTRIVPAQIRATES